MILGALAGIPFVVFGVLFGQWGSASSVRSRKSSAWAGSISRLSSRRVRTTRRGRHRSIDSGCRRHADADVRQRRLERVQHRRNGGSRPRSRPIRNSTSSASDSRRRSATSSRRSYSSSPSGATGRHSRSSVLANGRSPSNCFDQRPRILEGLLTFVMEFPFNAILLLFGTEVNAAYQIGRRVYQQITAPLSRGYRTGASIVVGQTLGDGDPEGPGSTAGRLHCWPRNRRRTRRGRLRRCRVVRRILLGRSGDGSVRDRLRSSVRSRRSVYGVVRRPRGRSRAEAIRGRHSSVASPACSSACSCPTSSASSGVRRSGNLRLDRRLLPLGDGVRRSWFYRGAWIERTQAMMDERGSTPGEK